MLPRGWFLCAAIPLVTMISRRRVGPVEETLLPYQDLSEREVHGGTDKKLCELIGYHGAGPHGDSEEGGTKECR